VLLDEAQHREATAERERADDDEEERERAEPRARVERERHRDARVLMNSKRTKFHGPDHRTSQPSRRDGQASRICPLATAAAVRDALDRLVRASPGLIPAGPSIWPSATSNSVRPIQ